MKATAKFTENDGRSWFELNGTDNGTGHEFNSETYGVTKDGEILDADGVPLNEDDWECIAVLNALTNWTA